MDPTAGEQRAELAEWLASDDARAAAGADLGRVRLPTDADHVDDVLSEVALRMLGRLARRGPIDEHREGRSGVVPYARTTVANVVNDLFRARHRSLDRLVAEARAEGVDGGPVGIDPDGGVEALEDELAAGQVATGLRRTLHAQIHPSRRWSTAAALTCATLALHPDIALPPDVPVPDNGAEGNLWAGLHLAARTDCFERPDTQAVRARRSRAMDRVRGTLRSAWAAVAPELGAA